MANLTKNHKKYSVIELFAGAGGMALGFEKAGFETLLLNEIDRTAAKTLNHNRPKWNVINADIKTIDFSKYHNQADVVTGGFPCQAFSHAGKRLGFDDARGTLFYEFARVVKEVSPKIAIGENVRGLVTHDSGKTLAGMISVMKDIGYIAEPYKVLNAVSYDVPQKRERIILVFIREDLYNQGIRFEYPNPQTNRYVLKDALLAGALYPTDVPQSVGQSYPDKKKKIFKLIPPGGCWTSLPEDIQKEYLMKSYYLGGGKTGIARRISWDEPSLTLTCSPSQKQTDRCHPDAERPFTVREYARIQTFPDDWEFCGAITNQYKQIGNAVPVNLAYHVAKSTIQALNSINR